MAGALYRMGHFWYFIDKIKKLLKSIFDKCKINFRRTFIVSLLGRILPECLLVELNLTLFHIHIILTCGLKLVLLRVFMIYNFEASISIGEISSESESSSSFWEQGQHFRGHLGSLATKAGEIGQYLKISSSNF